MTPQRVQRRRTKGWRMPENTVYVGRGSKWGNPVSWKDILEDGCSPQYARQIAVEWFDDNLTMRDVEYPDRPTIRTELAGKNLACWCPLDQPCHADVLLEHASERSQQ